MIYEGLESIPYEPYTFNIDLMSTSIKVEEARVVAGVRNEKKICSFEMNIILYIFSFDPDFSATTKFEGTRLTRGTENRKTLTDLRWVDIR